MHAIDCVWRTTILATVLVAGCANTPPSAPDWSNVDFKEFATKHLVHDDRMYAGMHRATHAQVYYVKGGYSAPLTVSRNFRDWCKASGGTIEESHRSTTSAAALRELGKARGGFLYNGVECAGTERVALVDVNFGWDPKGTEVIALFYNPSDWKKFIEHYANREPIRLAEEQKAHLRAEREAEAKREREQEEALRHERETIAWRRAPKVGDYCWVPYRINSAPVMLHALVTEIKGPLARVQFDGRSNEGTSVVLRHQQEWIRIDNLYPESRFMISR